MNLNPPESTTDPWALQYITFLCIQPLIEAFDDDTSGYVTINEANAFSAGRPKTGGKLETQRISVASLRANTSPLVCYIGWLIGQSVGDRSRFHQIFLLKIHYM